MTAFYELKLLPDCQWHQCIESEYDSYKKEYKPRASAVTYLIYSGASHAGFERDYFNESMADSYATAFHIHQRPLRTADIHKYFIKKLPYFWYLLLVALPVDIVAHTVQFFIGETGNFLEGGAFFIPYMISHWTLLIVAVFARAVYKYVSPTYWPLYFYLLKLNLIIHERVYGLTLRKLSLKRRIAEFLLFLVFTHVFCNKIF
jgi:hypothetical protein